MSTLSKHSTTTDETHSKIEIAGDSNEFIIMGGQKFLRHELMGAMTMNNPTNKFANPGPLGLCAFGISTFVLCLINAQASGVTTPNLAVGLAVFYGGTVQFLAGVWEFFVGNTFGFVALVSYGSFWLSWAAIYIPGFGVQAAYAEDPEQLKQAAGLFLTGFAIFTFMLMILTIRTNVAFFALFFCLFMTFVLLAAGDFTLNVGITRAGGVFGVITALIAFYNAFAGVATKQNSYFGAKTFKLP
ncbi:unnamed protein product [Candida verbasci]|uniref:Uncharacterized protein n=1 Tax=Candida verbasci TaxID=1227364 RepID=A0A9W4TSR4_9ASCO|nr:unnamed protein product [Candida verbasci]